MYLRLHGLESQECRYIGNAGIRTVNSGQRIWVGQKRSWRDSGSRGSYIKVPNIETLGRERKRLDFSVRSVQSMALVLRRSDV